MVCVSLIRVCVKCQDLIGQACGGSRQAAIACSHAGSDPHTAQERAACRGCPPNKTLCTNTCQCQLRVGSDWMNDDLNSHRMKCWMMISVHVLKVHCRIALLVSKHEFELSCHVALLALARHHLCTLDQQPLRQLLVVLGPLQVAPGQPAIRHSVLRKPTRPVKQPQYTSYCSIPEN